MREYILNEDFSVEEPTPDAHLASTNPLLTTSSTNNSTSSTTGPSSLAPSRIREADPQAIAKIEKVFQSVTDDLLHNRDEIYISIKIKKSPAVLRIGEESSIDPVTEVRKVTFPGRTAHEAWRFTVLFRILELIHEALTSNIVVSKRNIYYKDPSLFKTQVVVDRCVDALAYTFDVPRAKLNVTAAAKGLVVGDFTLKHRDGTTKQVQSGSAAMLVDDVQEIQAIDIPGVAWVLVVEKESTFRTLASSEYYRNSKAGKGIILTAKGYPDISTRTFLRLLSTAPTPTAPEPPIYALVDFDPDGIAIMSTYKHGSANLSHENANLTVPSMRWLGLRSCDLHNNEAVDESKGLLRLTVRDRKKAVKMLEKALLEENGAEREWRRELQVMLMVGVKAEMELLAERGGGLEGWLGGKLLADVVGNME